MSPSIPQPAEPLSPERLAEIREADPGDWYNAPWTTEYVDSDGDEPAYYRVKSEGHVIATLPDYAGPLAEFIADAREAVPALLAEIERLTARVAELEGAQEATSLALPWAHRMSDWDLHCFLDDLVSAAIDRWRSEPSVPDRQVLASIEKACAEWRTPGQGSRSDDPETTPDTEAGDR